MAFFAVKAIIAIDTARSDAQKVEMNDRPELRSPASPCRISTGSSVEARNIDCEGDLVRVEGCSGTIPTRPPIQRVTKVSVV
jgi:hypothetical protein